MKLTAWLDSFTTRLFAGKAAGHKPAASPHGGKANVGPVGPGHAPRGGSGPAIATDSTTNKAAPTSPAVSSTTPDAVTQEKVTRFIDRPGGHLPPLVVPDGLDNSPVANLTGLSKGDADLAGKGAGAVAAALGVDPKTAQKISDAVSGALGALGFVGGNAGNYTAAQLKWAASAPGGMDSTEGILRLAAVTGRDASKVLGDPHNETDTRVGGGQRIDRIVRGDDAPPGGADGSEPLDS